MHALFAERGISTACGGDPSTSLLDMSRTTWKVTHIILFVSGAIVDGWSTCLLSKWGRDITISMNQDIIQVVEFYSHPKEHNIFIRKGLKHMRLICRNIRLSIEVTRSRMNWQAAILGEPAFTIILPGHGLITVPTFVSIVLFPDKSTQDYSGYDFSTQHRTSSKDQYNLKQCTLQGFLVTYALKNLVFI